MKPCRVHTESGHAEHARVDATADQITCADYRGSKRQHSGLANRDQPSIRPV